MTDRSGEGFNDDQVRALITRALEIEALGGATTAEELREIAAEVGIAPEAIEVALREHRRQTSHLPVAHRGRAGLAVAASGLSLGIATGTTLSLSGSLLGIGVLGMQAAGLLATGALILTLGKRPAHRTFQFRNAVLWAGVGLGGLLSSAVVGGGPVMVTAMVAGWSIRGWITSSVLGSAAVMAILRTNTPIDPNGRSSGLSLLRHRVGTFAKKVRVWLRREVARTRSNIAHPASTLHGVLVRFMRPNDVSA